MQKIRVRFLEKGEEARLPKGAKMLPKPWRKAYIEHRKPYYLEGDTAVIQTTAENSLYWRKQAAALLEKLKQEGTEVIIPPAEGELPKGILPLADGKRMMYLFPSAKGRIPFGNSPSAGGMMTSIPSCFSFSSRAAACFLQ